MSILAHTESQRGGEGKGRFRPAVPFAEAVRLCTYRLASDPRNTTLLLQRARAYMQLDNPRAALADLSRCLSLHESDACVTRDSTVRRAEALFYSGRCHEQLGDDRAAAAAYTAALALDPHSHRAAYARAACRNRQGDFAGAIEDYERALAEEAAGGGAHRGLPVVPRAGYPSGCDESHPCGASSSRSGSGGSLVGARAARSLFAVARRHGRQPPPYVAQLQRRREQRVSARRAPSAEVSRSTSFGISTAPVTAVGDESVASHAAGVGGPRGGVSMLVTVADERPAEWVESGVSGVDALDPASFMPLSASSYSLSDLSDEECEVAVPVGGRGVAPEEGARSADLFVQRGLQFRKRGELQNAIDMYTKALEVDPMHFKALFNRAFCYDKVGRLSDAVDDYRAASKVDPSNAYTLYNLGITYDRLEDLALAVDAFTKAIERDHGRNADFFHNRGLSLRKMGDYHAAIEDYSRAIAIDPMHFKSHFNRGYCYDRLGHLERAVDDYTAALRVEPNSANALHNRGVALGKLGRLPEALDNFDRALAVDPTSAYTYNARGLAHDQVKHYAAAVADFSEALRLQPSHPVFLSNRGHTYRSMGRFDEAVADYAAVIARDANSLAAYNGRAFAYRKLGQYESAIRDYTTVISAQLAGRAGTVDVEARAKALNNRAYCYARLERYPEAVRDYTAALALDPGNTHALHNRAISYEKSGDVYAAVEDLTQLLEVCTKAGTRHGAETASSAYFSRGSAWARLGRDAHAIRDFNESLAFHRRALPAQDAAALDRAMKAHPAWQALQRLRDQGPQ